MKSFLSGLGFFGPRCRSSVWQKQASHSQELQTLESRLVMSSVSLSADPGGARTSPFVPAEDLYDEGAGAVWGGLMDPLGGQRSPTLFPPVSTGGNFGPGDPDGKPEGDPGVDVGGGYGGGVGVCGTGTDGGGSTGGSSVGGGSVGGGSGNLPQEELELICTDADALEGPYRIPKLDEAEVIIRRVGFSRQRTVNALLKITGTASHQSDYRLSANGRPINPWRRQFTLRQCHNSCRHRDRIGCAEYSDGRRLGGTGECEAGVVRVSGWKFATGKFDEIRNRHQGRDCRSADGLHAFQR
ncbi:MAG UNVERIFIED_CONTAM: hypothetical protein LVR18_29780 [Planctomycetaceae bacterium]